MNPLNEARWWEAADAPPTFHPGEQRAYESATNLPSVTVELDMDVEEFQGQINHAIWNLRALGASAELADLTAPDPDAMPTREDATAERGGNPLVAAAVLAVVGLVLGIILVVIL